MGERAIKPPLGVLNRKHYELFLGEDIAFNGGMCLSEIQTKRINDLKGAIQRYIEAEWVVNLEWVIELNELLNQKQ